MKLTKNFSLQEFVPPAMYKKWGDKSVQFIDMRIVYFAQALRDNLGMPIVINNWHTGGQYKESGLRAFNTPTGASMSQHKFGRAVDLKISDSKGVIRNDSGAILRKHVQDNWDKYKQWITTTEADTDSWAHFDCRYTGQDTLLIVPMPKK
jgi:hypothetical protein